MAKQELSKVNIKALLLVSFLHSMNEGNFGH